MPTTDRPTVGSPGVRALLATPARGRVLGAFPTALYVGLGRGDVLAGVTADGVQLPDALVLPTSSVTTPLSEHRAGQPAQVADGALSVGGVRYRAVRERADARPAPPVPVRAAVVDELARRLAVPGPGSPDQALRAGTAELRAALAGGDAARACAAADTLLGRGPGLTPSGDDVLAGALVTSARLRHTPGAAVVAATAARLAVRVARTAPDRTCALSASLLRHAAQGRAAPPVVDLVDALLGAGPLDPALTALLAVGHTSGADTARGVLAAGQALARPGDGSADA